MPSSTPKLKPGQRGEAVAWVATHLSAPSMQEAKVAARSTGRWKNARHGQGDGQRVLVLQCVQHVECPAKRKIALAGDNFFHIFDAGEHTETENRKKRKNSAMDMEQEQELLGDIWKGVKPAGSKLAMTLSKEAELVEAGKDPADHKKPNGGLQGECLDADRKYSCIVVVFRLYSRIHYVFCSVLFVYSSWHRIHIYSIIFVVYYKPVFQNTNYILMGIFCIRR